MNVQVTLRRMISVLEGEEQRVQRDLASLRRAVEGMNGKAPRRAVHLTPAARKKMSMAAKARWAKVKRGK